MFLLWSVFRRRLRYFTCDPAARAALPATDPGRLAPKALRFCYVLSMRITALLGVALSLSACDPSKVKTAVADLEPTCAVATAAASALVEDILAKDYRFFAPLFLVSPDPAADEAYCESLITVLGAKAPSLGAAPVRRAALMCREAARVVWENRVGAKAAIATYATTAGRMAAEGVAGVIERAISERHGEVAPDFDFAVPLAAECLAAFFDGLEVPS